MRLRKLALIGLVVGGTACVGTTAFAVQTALHNKPVDDMAARRLEPNAIVCAQINDVAQDEANVLTAELADLEKKAADSPREHIEYAVSFNTKVTPNEVRKKVDSLSQIRGMSASLPRFIDGTNLNSNYTFDSSLTAEENISRWKAYLLGSIDDQKSQIETKKIVTSDNAENLNRIAKLRARVDSGQIDVVGVQLEGSGANVADFLKDQKANIYAAGAGTDEAPMPADDATRSIAAKVCSK